jgi:hypothetical protein
MCSMAGRHNNRVMAMPVKRAIRRSDCFERAFIAAQHARRTPATCCRVSNLTSIKDRAQTKEKYTSTVSTHTPRMRAVSLAHATLVI